MVRVIVIGASGYTGRELLRILIAHPGVELVGLFGSPGSKSEGRSVDELHPSLRGCCDLPIKPFDMELVSALSPDAAFLATPHEASVEMAPVLLDAGIVTLDISGGFRLSDPAAYPAHYGFEHRHPELLADAVYGLPELNRAAIADADLIACPGCYPTATILALRPLIDAGLVRTNTTPIVDAVSGASGAGRSPSARTHVCEISLQPYGVLGHRHAPEIAQHSGAAVHFVPHLAEFDRGILATIHIELADGIGAREIAGAYSRYEHEPFVRLLSSGEWPALAGVRNTNFCDLGWTLDSGGTHLVVVSAIDNLIKGASGQAVQCMNIRFGLPEQELGPYGVGTQTAVGELR